MKNIVFITFILVRIGLLAQEKSYNFTMSNYYGDLLGVEKPGTEPMKFAPNFISITGEINMCLAISSDGKQMAYTTSDLESTRAKNMYLRQINGRWTNPVELKFPEYKCTVNPRFIDNGKKLQLTVCDSADYRFCYTELKDSTYTELTIFSNKHIVGENAFAYTVDSDSIYYFCGKRADMVGGNTDIYRSYTKDDEIIFENVKPLNGTWDDDSPIILGNGKYLFYNQLTYQQTDSATSHIKFCTRNKDKSWSEPYNIGEYLGLQEFNWGPALSPDEKYLFLSVNSTQGFDIYWVNAEILKEIVKNNQ